jgi:hypothetical protein
MRWYIGVALLGATLIYNFVKEIIEIVKIIFH